MKKIIISLGAVAVLLALYLVFSADISKMVTKQDSSNGELYWEFTELPDGVVAQAGDQISVSWDEINNTAPMRAFRNRRRDVLFALVYLQYVSRSKTPVSEVEFSFKKISRSPEKMLARYGVPKVENVQVKFSSFDVDEGLAKVDGRIINEQDLDQNNFIWASFQSDIFRYRLNAIDDLIKRKAVQIEAEKAGLTTKKYKENYINKGLPEKVSENDVKAYMKRYKIEDTPRNRASAQKRLLQKRRRRGLDYLLEKFVLPLPVKVALEIPELKLDAKPDWTPTFGEGKALGLTLFSDTRSSAAEKIIPQLMDLTKKFPDIRFFYRPVFLEKDRLQTMTTQAQFCVLKQSPSVFWDFFKKSLGDFKQNTENSIIAIAMKTGVDVDPLKNCMQANTYKEVVDYHLQYARYLGFESGPVLFIEGEVLQGNIIVSEVERIIERKLKIPKAGLW